MGQAHRGAFEGRDVGKVARCLVKPFPIAEACEIVRVAAIGLDYAHANGIVHRDIKPSNLMVNRQGAVKILDFGLVQLDGWSGATLEVTSVGQLLGTLDYMAPEQADRADSADHRSDIYSLGATLFRLLAGRAPFAANANQSPLEKLRLLANERPPRILTLRPDLPPELAEIIDKSLDRNPQNRPQSAGHLAELLQPYCESANVEQLISTIDETQIVSEKNQSHFTATQSLLSDRLPQKQIQAKSVRRQPGGPWRVVKYLVALAALVGIVWAGIVLVLDTQKGQVVIETDSANLHVKLVAESGARKEIELIPGENSTRIYAGRYEIQIDDGTDRYVIDQDTFLLKRGEKVVAKVTVNTGEKKAAVAWSDNSHASSSNPTAQSDYTEPEVSPDQMDKQIVAAYKVNGDSELYTRIIGTVLGSDSGARLVNESANSRIIVFATSRQHDAITVALKTLEANRNVGKPFTERVYNGKTLDEWRNLLEFETNAGEIENAANGVQALIAGDPELLHTTREWVVNSVVSGKSNAWCNSLVMRIGLDDQQITRITSYLSKARPDQISRLLEMLFTISNQPREQSSFGISDWLSLVNKGLSRPDVRESASYDQVLSSVDAMVSRAFLRNNYSKAEKAELLSFIHEKMDMGFANLPERAAGGSFVGPGEVSKLLPDDAEKEILFEIALRNSMASLDDSQSWLKQLNYAAKFIPAIMSNETRDRLALLVDQGISQISMADDLPDDLGQYFTSDNVNKVLREIFDNEIRDQATGIRFVVHGNQQLLQDRNFQLLCICRELGMSVATPHLPAIESIAEATKAQYDEFVGAIKKGVSNVTWLVPDDGTVSPTRGTIIGETVVIWITSEGSPEVDTRIHVDVDVSDAAILHMLALKILNPTEANASDEP